MILSLMAALTLAAPQASGPSFDCARASGHVERSICADPALARLDRELADRYAVVRRALAPAAREALLADQQWFLGIRGDSQYSTLRDQLTARLEFLQSVETVPAVGLAGIWENLAGRVEITEAGGGRLHLAFVAAEPLDARWICEGEMTGRPVNGSLQGAIDGETDAVVQVRLRDGFLELTETVEGVRGYCGMNGFVSGAYFRVG